jgi:hypothetical protein
MAKGEVQVTALDQDNTLSPKHDSTFPALTIKVRAFAAAA